MIPLKIGSKTARIPVIQGGMGVGISLGGLAGAVAKTGAVGMISSAQIGYQEPDFDYNTRKANVRAIVSEFQKARKAAPDGIIGFNIMVALKDYQEHVKTAVAVGADLIVSGAGLPTELPELVKGSRTMIAPIVSTNKSIRIILKYWDKKFNRTADLIVIEGPKAGGHLGFKKEELDKFDDLSYNEEIKEMIQTVRIYEKKFQTSIPVILAGGIYTNEDVRKALALGVDGVQIGTRFITTVECDADSRLKEAYLQAGEDDIVIVKSPVGMPGRAILNPFMKRVMSGEQIPHTSCHRCLARCNPQDIPYCITDGLIHAAKGNVDEALLFSGAYGYKAKRIETVQEVIELLFSP